MKPVFTNGIVTYVKTQIYPMEGRCPYGTNPLDNDTDGDMMPDFYEYYRGWNETNDNWSLDQKFLLFGQLLVVWKPVQVSNGLITSQC